MNKAELKDEGVNNLDPLFDKDSLENINNGLLKPMLNYLKQNIDDIVLKKTKRESAELILDSCDLVK